MTAQVEIETGKQNLILEKINLATGKVEFSDTKACIHTAITHISAEEFADLKNDTDGQENFYKNIYSIKSTEGFKTIDLSIEEKFKAFKSWAQGIAEAGEEGLKIQSEIEQAAKYQYPILNFLLGFLYKIDKRYLAQFLDKIERECIHEGNTHISSYKANMIPILQSLGDLYDSNRFNDELAREIYDRIRRITEHPLELYIENKEMFEWLSYVHGIEYIFKELKIIGPEFHDIEKWDEDLIYFAYNFYEVMSDYVYKNDELTEKLARINLPQYFYFFLYETFNKNMEYYPENFMIEIKLFKSYLEFPEPYDYYGEYYLFDKFRTYITYISKNYDAKNQLYSFLEKNIDFIEHIHHFIGDEIRELHYEAIREPEILSFFIETMKIYASKTEVKKEMVSYLPEEVYFESKPFLKASMKYYNDYYKYLLIDFSYDLHYLRINSLEDRYIALKEKARIKREKNSLALVKILNSIQEYNYNEVKIGNFVFDALNLLSPIAYINYMSKQYNLDKPLIKLYKLRDGFSIQSQKITFFKQFYLLGYLVSKIMITFDVINGKWNSYKSNFSHNSYFIFHELYDPFSNNNKTKKIIKTVEMDIPYDFDDHPKLYALFDDSTLPRTTLDEEYVEGEFVEFSADEYEKANKKSGICWNVDGWYHQNSFIIYKNHENIVVGIRTYEFYEY